jgi:hypothetical protein
MSYRLKFESQLLVEAALRHVGNPNVHLAKLSDSVGNVGRSTIRVLKSFTYLGGVIAEPEQKLTIEADLARGLAKTGAVEILK